METSIGNLWLWVGFHIFVVVMLALDLGVAQRKPHAMSKGEAAGWSALWIFLSMVFAGGIWWFFGAEKSLEYVAGYLIEKSLSVDNLFVFLMIFNYFKVPAAYQHRVLYWGILGAVVMRATMIAAGTALLLKFHFLILIFAALLIWSALKILVAGEDDDADVENQKIVKLFKRLVPMTDQYDGSRFTTIVDGARRATPLLLVVVTVEVSDVIFALDSIPAIFGVSSDPFIIYTSNIFAILGLRALYFLLAAMLQGLRFLQPAVALVLLFIGGKMVVGYFGHHLSIGLSLGVVGTLLAGGVILSLVFPAKSEDEPPTT